MTETYSPLYEQLNLDRLLTSVGEEVTRARNSNDPEIVSSLLEANETLQNVLSRIGWRVTSERLESRYRITHNGMLKLKFDYPPPVQDDEKEEFSTADRLYESLKMTHETRVHCQASVLRWIDHILMRIVSVTLRSGPNREDNITVTHLERARVPGMMIEQHPYLVAGFMDSSKLSPIKDMDRSFWEELWSEERNLAMLQKHAVQFLYISEPKGDFNEDLEMKVPQAILEMYSCAMSLQKQVIRGILTSGHQWIFLVLEVNEDADGGQYYKSEPFDLVDPYTYEVSKDASVVLTDIIAYWVCRSHEQVGPDDRFSIVRDAAD